VKWQIPLQDAGHGMTLIGGNYGPAGNPKFIPSQSVWHNSDGEGPGNVDDEVYLNTWGPSMEWKLDFAGTPAIPNDDWWADGYFLSCPGVPKPANAIGNFDVHCYKGIKIPFTPGNPPDYGTETQLLTTGQQRGTYRGPQGQTDGYWDSGAQLPTLIVPNLAVGAGLHKELYISVDFNDPLPNRVAPNIQVLDDQGNLIGLANSQWASDNGQVLLQYTFPSQPLWEQVIFPGNEYKDLLGLPNYNVVGWNIATECVPEPGTLALLAFGAIVAFRRRRRK